MAHNTHLICLHEPLFNLENKHGTHQNDISICSRDILADNCCIQIYSDAIIAIMLVG